MSNSIADSLTYRQREVLRQLYAGTAGISRSCTNTTLCSLERRGLTDYSFGTRTWSITKKGVETAQELVK